MQIHVTLRQQGQPDPEREALGLRRWAALLCGQPGSPSGPANNSRRKRKLRARSEFVNG